MQSSYQTDTVCLWFQVTLVHAQYIMELDEHCMHINQPKIIWVMII